MIQRDPKCVFVAPQLGVAHVVVAWLAERGISAQVMNLTTLAGLDGLTPWSSAGVAGGGIEVWVLHPRDAPRALELLAEREQSEAARLADLDAKGEPIEAVCEACGRASVFPAKLRGSVQECPGCGAYVDVGAEDERAEMDAEECGGAGEATGEDNDAFTAGPP